MELNDILWTGANPTSVFWAYKYLFGNSQRNNKSLTAVNITKLVNHAKSMLFIVRAYSLIL